jgi:hypothetical protein
MELPTAAMAAVTAIKAIAVVLARGS